MNIPKEAMDQVDQPALKRRYGGSAGVDSSEGLQFNVQAADGYSGYGGGMSNETETQMPYQQHPEQDAPVYEPLYEDDEPVFPGGPFESQVLSWKKQFGEIFLATIGEDDAFIFRPLTRFEYKQIIAAPNTDPLMREEFICETCTVWPVMSWQEMGGDKAGTPARLSEQILDKSNFTRNVTVRPL